MVPIAVTKSEKNSDKQINRELVDPLLTDDVKNNP